MGMHFFSPADVMKLVECVRGTRTDSDTISQVMTVAKKIKKTPVLVGNCRGFCGNRMIAPYGFEALCLVEEGASVDQVDAAMLGMGFKMGPFQMQDLAGNDVSYNIRKEQGLTDPALRDPKIRYCALGDELFRLKRLGQKSGMGWYKYAQNSRVPEHDPEVDRLVEAYRRTHAVTPRAISEQEIQDRLLLPLINEGLKILWEGIAACPGDIDIIFVLGYGWPPFLGKSEPCPDSWILLWFAPSDRMLARFVSYAPIRRANAFCATCCWAAPFDAPPTGVGPPASNQPSFRSFGVAPIPMYTQHKHR